MDNNSKFNDIFSGVPDSFIMSNSNNDNIDDNFFKKIDSGKSASVNISSFSRNKKLELLKKKKKQRKILNVVLSIILVISTLWTAYVGAISYLMGDMIYDSTNFSASDLGIDQNVAASLNNKIINIALFGVDSRDATTDKGRSDSIMILSVNTKDNTLKLTSILRDSYVAIEGHKKQKINHAYSLGGVTLAMKTINQNYELNVADYVTVNLQQLSKVIDVLDGIDLEITNAEKNELNRLAVSENLGVTKVASSGNVHLNGPQAMTYARIREIDSDSVRSERQGKVLNCMLEKIKAMSVIKYPAILKSILSNVETSLSYSEIIAFSPMVTKGNLTLTKTTVPIAEDQPIGGIYGGAWVYRYDLHAASARIHTWIYGDATAK